MQPIRLPVPVPVETPAPGPGTADALTEAAGLLIGLQLYRTYLNVGFLADARAAGLHEASESAQLLASVLDPLDLVERQLEKIRALGELGEDDAATLARMRTIVGHLREQGRELQAYWETGGEDRGKKYEDARQAAWNELDDLLQLSRNKAPATAPDAPGQRPGRAPDPTPLPCARRFSTRAVWCVGLGGSDCAVSALSESV